jgi:4-amino-4-deoxy-L-arabinose transferase-like glycosyltransferase
MADTVQPSTPSRRPWLGLVACVGVALFLNCWALSRNGLGNTYYAAAARSMTTGWRNFFFASFDPGGFISVDKPPVALWIEAVSARVFGFSSWSLLLPSAVAGAASVGVLWATVRRRFGTAAATVAGLVLATSPINVAVNRLNLPDPFMVLFLLLAAWAVLRGVEQERPWKWLALAGVFVGLAFNTKMLAAYVPVPALLAGIAVGTSGSLGKKARAVLLFGAVALAASAPWIAAVDLTPASARPYVGGSQNNTERDLVFGYNGFGRVDGDGQGGGANLPGLGGPGGIFGGAPGWLRMWNDANAGQIAWLLPIAGLGAIASLYRARRDRLRLASVALWSVWLAVTALVFSFAKGTFHSYYMSALAPAVAALVGIGGVALAGMAVRQRAWLAAAVATLVVTAAVEFRLSGREPAFYGWTRAVLAFGVVAAVGGFALAGVRRSVTTVVAASALVGLTATAFVPTAWAVSELDNPPLNASLPQAGPRTGASGSTFGSEAPRFASNHALAEFLLSERNGEQWDLVVRSAQQGAALIADEGLAVMALGGFLGSDPAATVDSIADLVAAGKVRFFERSGDFGGRGGPGGAFPTLPFGNRGNRGNRGQFPGFGGGNGGGGGFPGGGGGAGGRGTAPEIMRAVAYACTAVTSASTGGRLPAAYDGLIYDCAGKADALRAAS